MSPYLSEARIGILVLVAAVAGGLSAGCGRKTPSAPRLGDVIATVGDRPITRGELEAEVVRRYGPLQLRDLVDREIVRQQAAARKITVDPDRVQAKMEQALVQAGGQQALQERLTREGQTLEGLRGSLAREALVEQVMASQVTVSDADVKRYYDSHPGEFKHGEMIKGRLILLETRQNAEALRQVLQDPKADFAGLAQSLSLDPGTKDKGGDMGWIERGDYATQITDVAFKLQPGQVSDVIEYPDGFALVRVEDRKPAGVKPLEEVRDGIRALLSREQEMATAVRWALEQRRQARIKVHDPSLRRGFELLRDR